MLDEDSFYGRKHGLSCLAISFAAGSQEFISVISGPTSMPGLVWTASVCTQP